MIYFYNIIFCKTVLIYFIHWITCFEYYNEAFYFISFKLLKWDVTDIILENTHKLF